MDTRRQIERELTESARQIKRLEAQVNELRANQRPPSYDAAAKLSNAFHDADSLFGMFGERAPQHYTGEKPERYAARLNTALQKFLPDSSRFKNAVFNDSLPPQAFELMEKAMRDEILAEAKNPTRLDSAMRNSLIPRKTHDELGRTRTEYHGSSRAALGFFLAPSFTGRIVRPEKG